MADEAKEMQERIQAAESRMQHLLPPAEDRELKTLYYALVKRLHPDVNPNLTEDQKRRGGAFNRLTRRAT